MYTCNNCNTAVPTPEGKCTGCNIKLSPEGVSLRSSQIVADTDLNISHRCTNCGDVLRNRGGKCNTCRYPIAAIHLQFVPQAEVIPIHSYTLAPSSKAAG